MHYVCLTIYPLECISHENKIKLIRNKKKNTTTKQNPETAPKAEVLFNLGVNF